MSETLLQDNVRQMADDTLSEVERLFARAEIAADKLADCERTQKTSDKNALEAAFELALLVRDIMDQHDISATEVANRISRKPREVQRLRKLADHVARLRQEIANGEDGENFVYPRWRSLVPENRGDASNPIEGRKLEIGRQIVEESNRGKRADLTKIARLEAELDELRDEDAVVTLQPVTDAALVKHNDNLRQRVADLEERNNDLEIRLSWYDGSSQPVVEHTASLQKEIEEKDKEIANLKERLAKKSYGKQGRGEQDRGTPDPIYDPLHAEFDFGMDCAGSERYHKHPNYLTKAQNALMMKLPAVPIWCNPPWNNIPRFMKKGYITAKRTKQPFVLLVPMWCSEPWFHEFAVHAEIRVLTERVAFIGYDGEAPTPMMLVIFRGESQMRPDGALHVRVQKVPKTTRLRRQIASVFSQSVTRLSRRRAR